MQLFIIISSNKLLPVYNYRQRRTRAGPKRNAGVVRAYTHQKIFN